MKGQNQVGDNWTLWLLFALHIRRIMPATWRHLLSGQEMKLIAPNSLLVVGIKLTDNSVSEFEYSHDARTQTSLFILPDGKAAITCNPTVLVDAEGNEWGASDVEFHSFLNIK